VSLPILQKFATVVRSFTAVRRRNGIPTGVATMAGIKQFDRHEALDRAMAVFWERGYAATSIQDLLEAMGINRGSLYATFGNKQQLFLAVLDHYAEQVSTAMLAELRERDPRRAIAQMFAALLRRTSDPSWPRGCLNTNTALECPGSGDAITRTIAERLGQQESALYHVLHRAQGAGALDRGQDCRALARFFVGVAQGVNVVHKAGADPATLHDIVTTALRALDTSLLRGQETPAPNGKKRPRQPCPDAPRPKRSSRRAAQGMGERTSGGKVSGS
jgi:TetR/AcrR family transcriptional repressor of nem operon